MSEKTFTEKVVDSIKRIPRGKVATYGLVAMMAGNRHGARQVVRILHTQTGKHDLPWHRVINSKGTISLTGEGYRIQRQMLAQEGVEFDSSDKVDFERFLWIP
ncbi:MGMT family protein [candidate division WOR-3 bacterium]|nr:MGMT family protein [candidate division WOR-3 bacterium]